MGGIQIMSQVVTIYLQSKVVERTGLEPVTFTLPAWCSPS